MYTPTFINYTKPLSQPCQNRTFKRPKPSRSYTPTRANQISNSNYTPYSININRSASLSCNDWSAFVRHNEGFHDCTLDVSLPNIYTIYEVESWHVGTRAQSAAAHVLHTLYICISAARTCHASIAALPILCIISGSAR